MLLHGQRDRAGKIKSTYENLKSRTVVGASTTNASMPLNSWRTRLSTHITAVDDSTGYNDVEVTPPNHVQRRCR